MKLLVDEAQSDQLRQISTTVDAIGVCRISWAEAMAALARLQREDPANNEDLEQARQQLICAWIGIEHLEGRTVGLGDHIAAIWVQALLDK